MLSGERLVWVTAAGQRVDHAVTSRRLGSAVGSGGAQIVAVCGERFWAAPLIADPGLPCPPCSRSASIPKPGQRADRGAVRTRADMTAAARPLPA